MQSPKHSAAAAEVSSRLGARPTVQALQQGGLLREDLRGVAPALHGKTLALEKEIKKDSLTKALNHRPELGALQAHGVLSPLSSPGGLAPSLTATAHALEHRMTGDALARHLRERPAKDTVEQLLFPSIA